MCPQPGQRPCSSPNTASTRHNKPVFAASEQIALLYIQTPPLIQTFLRRGISCSTETRSAWELSEQIRAVGLPRLPISQPCKRFRTLRSALFARRGRILRTQRPSISGSRSRFSDAEKLARHPDVDLVTVSVKVPDHYLPVMAAIEAGKHVYCEWPLGRNTDEAVAMLDAAERRGIRHVVGLQGQMSPAINYAKDLVAEGYLGRVLTATMIGCAPNWGKTIDRAYQADVHNGANLMTITGGHQI